MGKIGPRGPVAQVEMNAALRRDKVEMGGWGATCRPGQPTAGGRFFVHRSTGITGSQNDQPSLCLFVHGNDPFQCGHLVDTEVEKQWGFLRTVEEAILAIPLQAERA